MTQLSIQRWLEVHYNVSSKPIRWASVSISDVITPWHCLLLSYNQTTLTDGLGHLPCQGIFIKTKHHFNNIGCHISGRPANMSSQFDTFYQPFKANDGIYIPNMEVNDFASIAHTRFQENPWWRVDLEGLHCVARVRILNRAYRETSGMFQDCAVCLTSFHLP